MGKSVKGIIQSIEGNAIVVDGEYDIRAGRRLRKPKDGDRIQETVVAARYSVTVEIVIAAGKPTPKWLTEEGMHNRVLNISQKD